MHIDFYPGFGLRAEEAASVAIDTESVGIEGLWVLEAAQEPFAPLTVAALATTSLQLRTAVAVAFARNPMIIAQHAHDLARVSGGRFVLGLGTQVRPHIERRFSETWSSPAARMAEYLQVLRAIWSCWNEGTTLDHDGRFYRHTLMTPMFNPGPSGVPAPRIHLAAVGERMVRVAAEYADGIVLHPLSSPRTITETVLPGVGDAQRREFELSVPVLVATGETDPQWDAARTAVRKQLAFYASTPAYRHILALYGEGDRADALRQYSRDQRWDEMTGLITDELLTEFAVDTSPSEVAPELERRFSSTVDRVAIYPPYELPLPTLAAVTESASGTL